jgi:hypothetical protein
MVINQSLMMLLLRSMSPPEIFFDRGFINRTFIWIIQANNHGKQANPTAFPGSGIPGRDFMLPAYVRGQAAGHACIR